MESFNTVLLCTPMSTCHMQYSQCCNASMLSLSSDVRQTHSQNFVTSCPWPLKRIYGQTSFCARSKIYAHTNARISLHHALLCGCGQAVLLVVLLCKSRLAGWLLIETLNSVLFCTLPQATDKQCSRRYNFSKLTVSSGIEQNCARISLHHVPGC